MLAGNAAGAVNFLKIFIRESREVDQSKLSDFFKQVLNELENFIKDPIPDFENYYKALVSHVQAIIYINNAKANDENYEELIDKAVRELHDAIVTFSKKSLDNEFIASVPLKYSLAKILEKLGLSIDEYNDFKDKVKQEVTIDRFIFFSAFIQYAATYNKLLFAKLKNTYMPYSEINTKKKKVKLSHKHFGKLLDKITEDWLKSNLSYEKFIALKFSLTSKEFNKIKEIASAIQESMDKIQEMTEDLVKELKKDEKDKSELDDELKDKSESGSNGTSNTSKKEVVNEPSSEESRKDNK